MDAFRIKRHQLESNKKCSNIKDKNGAIVCEGDILIFEFSSGLIKCTVSYNEESDFFYLTSMPFGLCPLGGDVFYLNNPLFLDAYFLIDSFPSARLK